MSKHAVVNIGITFACILSALWVLLLVSSVNWVSSRSIVVSFEASLVTITTQKGALPAIASALGHLVRLGELASKLDRFMNRELWMEDAVTQFCGAGLDSLFRWCEMWTMVMFGSLAMLGAIILAVTLLLSGAGFMYYYATVHATATGRVGCKVCYGLAPVSLILGLTVYTLSTLNFGVDGRMSTGCQARSMYSAGFIMAWALAIFSWIPLYTMMLFMRRDPLEKQQGVPQEDHAFNPGAPAYSYGAPVLSHTEHVQGYSSTAAYSGQTTVYGGQTVQYGAAAPAPAAQPGYGAPAW